MRGWRRRVHELAALTGALTATLALMVWGASSASAGGPTSVLVTSPSSGEANALYYSDKEYEELEQLLGPPDTGTREEPPGTDLTNARQINVTWLAHDISPWRMDRVFPGESASGAVWIHTAAGVPDSMNGYWHRADHPTELRTLLKKLGVMGKAAKGEGHSGIFPAPWESDGVDADAGTASVAVGAAPPDGGTAWWANWWWTLPGAATGAALALVLRPYASRVRTGGWRRTRVGEPRQELRDV
ncbi:hypothetical protein ACQEWB_29675 [Streptomyces sp. CA-249302]|uniref:hypothetical protein n=1 Tax=Streptomyces sp. CA-249302 TaxID=3240058 RepID=UPI003D8A80AE